MGEPKKKPPSDPLVALLAPRTRKELLAARKRIRRALRKVLRRG